MSDHGSGARRRPTGEPDNSGDDYSWLFEEGAPSGQAAARRDRDPSTARTTAVPTAGNRRSQSSAGQPASARPAPARPAPQAEPTTHAADRTQVLPQAGALGGGNGNGGGSGNGNSGGGSGAAAPAAAPTRPGRSRRRVPLLRIVLAVLAAWLVFLIVTPIWAWSGINRVAAERSGASSAHGTTFLVVGSDRRSDLTKAERKEFGGGGGGSQRTDTIMLLHVPDSGEPTLVSIPRDSYVPIPGHGSNKINASFSFGGPTLLVKTVEQNTGMHIDGYIEVGFAGFVHVVNSVGGVHMCLKSPMKDADAHVNLKAGCQTLDGAQALGFVRDRHSLANGDLGRVENQRKLLAAIVHKAVSPATLLPWRYYSLLSSGSDSVTIGKKTSFSEMVRFARAMRAVSSGDGITTTVPIANANYMTNAGSSVLWDQDDAKKFFADLRAQ